ncbi:hypothetical protein M413DRAFT_25919 [Hebeloma cylindrosporum]|uniref:ferric-chelate reductase (NADPH) n=1 Tax=Hebeloma cylindrosporum TaxID=76867 RepID=A0A0C3CHE2_HEBCY|nr:hypothetical protein M413DRAFT_25919 [Hebeloma cylindrosporum h7]
MSALAPKAVTDAVGGPAQELSDASMVYNINMLFVALLAIYTIIRLPRLFSLLSIPWEWKNGHILYYTPYRPNRRIVQAMHSAYPPPKDNQTDESHTLYSHAHHVQRLTEKGAPVTMNPPSHIPACIKPLRPILTPLRARIAPGFSVAQLLVMSMYFYSLLYAAFYRSNIFTDSARTAWICISQLPFVFIFAQKNNVLGFILGYGYEKLNFFHRFVGRLVVLAANIHALHYFYKWSLKGTFTQSIKLPFAIWGIVTITCFNMIVFFSTQYWRQRAYNLFLATHIIGFIVIMPALYMHKPATLPYTFACIALYAFDHVARLVKSRLAVAHIRPLPELDLTRVEIPTINAGWRAGQHVRLRVISVKMGWLGWAEVHPFTIASVAESGPEGMVLMCKRAGGWTRKLHEIAKSGGYEEGGIGGREVRVVVEGPYGGPQHTVFSSFSAAVFVAGGSGITFALSAIQDLVQKDLRGASRVKIIELIWIVPNPACLAPVLPMLSMLVQQSVFTPLRISVFYTRAPTGKQPAFFAAASASPFADSPPSPPHPASRSGSASQSQYQRLSAQISNLSSSAHQPTHFPPGLTLAPGKPTLLKFIEHAINHAINMGNSNPKDVDEALNLTGVIVGVCGPVGLADDVAAAVSGVDPLRRDQVGGVELHEEVFGW